jgi:hypothetical protein
MPTDPPADFPDFDLPEGEGEDGTTVAFVSTMEPLALRVDEIDDDRIPEGLICMGSFFQGRLIARSAVPPETLDEIRDRHVFESPVRIALAAVEREPGLQCRLFALLPAEQLEGNEEPEEPWAASVPRFEDVARTADENKADESPEGAVVPILLGHIVRFAKDRKHPDDLAAEAADVLQTIIAQDQPLSNVVDKLLDDLLDT